jgi:hypothetical protein
MARRDSQGRFVPNTSTFVRRNRQKMFRNGGPWGKGLRLNGRRTRVTMAARYAEQYKLSAAQTASEIESEKPRWMDYKASHVYKTGGGWKTKKRSKAAASKYAKSKPLIEAALVRKGVLKKTKISTTKAITFKKKRVAMRAKTGVDKKQDWSKGEQEAYSEVYAKAHAKRKAGGRSQKARDVASKSASLDKVAIKFGKRLKKAAKEDRFYVQKGNTLARTSDPDIAQVMVSQGTTTPIILSNNPFSGLALDNPAEQIALLAPIEAQLHRLPGVGPIVAPMITPIVLGAGGMAVMSFAVPYIAPYLPEQVQPFANITTGAAVAAVLQFIPVGSAKFRGLLGGAVLTVGGALDVFNYYQSRMAEEGEEDELDMEEEVDLSGLALDNYGGSALDNYGALALDNSGYGDGGAYEVVGLSAEDSSLAGEYSDASLGDAYYSGADFDPEEGDAALKGSQHWIGRFGRPARRIKRQVSNFSRHAGKRGHRWGWLVRMVGWKNVQKLCALPPKQRVGIIKQLRQDAMASLQQSLLEQSALQAEAIPRSTAELAPRGVHSTAQVQATVMPQETELSGLASDNYGALALDNGYGGMLYSGS